MNWQDLFSALALVLIIEGILPFMNPAGMRRMQELISQIDDARLRQVGLVMMLGGAILLYLVRA